MEVRSSRRLRTLVTRMARLGLSANEIARALISMMARSTTLQSKAGYIDARPLTAIAAKSTCNARPDHTFGSCQEATWVAFSRRLDQSDLRVGEARDQILEPLRINHIVSIDDPDDLSIGPRGGIEGPTSVVRRMW